MKNRTHARVKSAAIRLRKVTYAQGFPLPLSPRNYFAIICKTGENDSVGFSGMLTRATRALRHRHLAGNVIGNAADLLGSSRPSHLEWPSPVRLRFTLLAIAAIAFSSSSSSSSEPDVKLCRDLLRTGDGDVPSRGDAARLSDVRSHRRP